MRGGQDNTLPTVGWITEDFLVTGHAGIEDQFEHGVCRRAKRAAGYLGAIFED
jgi:hypothetical protein